MKIKRLFCRHDYSLWTSYTDFKGIDNYVYVCSKCRKHKRMTKPLRRR